jgi:hypothetical protein
MAVAKKLDKEVEDDPFRFPSPYATLGYASSTVGGADLSQMAKLFTMVMERPVIDKTGLPGKYDFKLTFAPTSTGHGGIPGPLDEGKPSIFAALQEQLGLKFEPGKAPFEFSNGQRPTTFRELSRRTALFTLTGKRPVYGRGAALQDAGDLLRRLGVSFPGA